LVKRKKRFFCFDCHFTTAMMTSVCRSPLGIEKQFSLLNNHCQQCSNLQEQNLKLEEELSRARQYAQQCEDEAVELRRQLCAALKDLSKMKKSVESNGKLSTTQLANQGIVSKQHNSSNSEEASERETQAAPMMEEATSTPENCLESKRKVLLAEADENSQECSKRQRMVNDADTPSDQQTMVDMSLDESVGILQDLTAIWSQRMEAIKRIEYLLSSCPDSDLAPDASERLFNGLSIQVNLRLDQYINTQLSQLLDTSLEQTDDVAPSWPGCARTDTAQLGDARSLMGVELRSSSVMTTQQYKEYRFK
jgi:myosin heavy subunit